MSLGAGILSLPGVLGAPPPLSTCMNMGEAVKVPQSALLEATVPVPSGGNGDSQSRGHADSLWEDVLRTALCLLAAVNSSGIWPVVLCETYYLPVFWKNCIFPGGVEEGSLLPRNMCPLTSNEQWPLSKNEQADCLEEGRVLSASIKAL